MSAFNGSGTFVISGTGLPFVTGITISSTVANQLNTDLATGLSTTITKDGQTVPTANIPMGGFKVTGLGTSTTSGDAISYNPNTTWTPTDVSGAGLSLTINGAGYTVIGSLFYVWASITFPATANGNPVSIGGLPATVKNSAGIAGAFGVYGPSNDFGKFNANASTFSVFATGGATRANSSYSGATFYFQAIYPNA